MAGLKKYFFVFPAFLILFGACHKTDVVPEGFVRDIDGNLYKTIKIGSQVWMAENLRVTRYRNGATIPGMSSAKEWAAAYTGLWCDYNYQADSTYGKLYNWYALEIYADHNIAPEGWHVPTIEDWKLLVTTLGGEYTAGGRMKDTLVWSPVNESRKKVCGMNVLPGGTRDPWGIFRYKGEWGSFWTSSTSPDYAYTTMTMRLYNYNDRVEFWSTYRVEGHSVRCIRDY